MQSFDTDRHNFTVRGGRYHLEPLDFDAAARMAALQELPFQEQIDGLAKLLAEKAASDTPTWWLRLTGRKTPADAVQSLSMTQQARLFQEWLRGNASSMGMVVPGESSGSAN